MYKLFVIAKNNIKKQKGDMITFGIMTVIVSLLIFISVSVLTGVGNAYQKRFDEINGPHMIASVFDNEASLKSLRKAFEESGITDYEETEVLSISTEYKNKKDKEYEAYEFIIESTSRDPRILNVLTDNVSLKDNEVILPYHLKESYSVGDILQIKLGDKIKELKVAGYAENPWFCSPLSFGIYYIYVNDNTYAALASEDTGTVPSPIYKNILFKGILPDEDLQEVDMDELELKLSNTFDDLIRKEDRPGSPDMYKLYNNANWDLIKWGNGMLPSIVTSVILVFAIILLTISLIIVSFSINNFIQRNIRNTGILEASGYTVRELRWALTFQIMMISLAGIICGLITGIFTGNKIYGLFSTMIGITFNPGINYRVVLAVGLLLLIINYVTVRLLSRKYRKIVVLDALRGGINTHNFKKNFFSFDKTNLPIPLTLALKDTFGGLGKNVVLSLIIAVLAMTCITGFGLVNNFSTNPEGTIKIIGVDLGDLSASGENGHADDLRKLDKVENVLTELTFEPVFEYDGKSGKYFTTAHDDEKYSKKIVIVEGRYAEKDNEIMISTAVADETGAGIGDVVTIKVGEESKDFIVTGINQRMMSAGKNLSLTIDGAKRLGVDTGYCDYLVTAKEGVSYEELKKSIEGYAKEEDITFNYENMSNVIDATVKPITSAMSGASMVFVLITALIVIFVESLVIRAKITREWRDMGISKAIGMSSGTLLLQIAMSNIPAVVFGSVLGALVSGYAGKLVVLGAFSYMGIKKIEFDQSIASMIAVALGIIAVAFITSALVGRKVKKLIPIEMITEE